MWEVLVPSGYWVSGTLYVPSSFLFGVNADPALLKNGSVTNGLRDL